MSAQVLTVEAAKNANIDVILNGKYTQTVHDVVTAIRAAGRSGTACVKTKATVNGSGSKPWRQKGTGRARAGYRSSPVWSGGGVVFGPHQRDYSKKVNKTVKKIALRKALSERIKAGDVLVAESFSVGEIKTRKFVELVKSLTPETRVLIIGNEFDETTYKAGRNVGETQLVRALDVNTQQLLAYKKIILTNDALTTLAGRISK